MTTDTLNSASLTACSDAPAEDTPSIHRPCGACGEAIPTIRLKAVPNALLCAPCLSAQGDVPRTRRFDEYTGDGEVVQTFFTKSRRIETAIHHLLKDSAPTEAYEQAVGDDSFLTREIEAVDSTGGFEYEATPDSNNISDEGRDAISEAQKKRWAKWRAERAQAAQVIGAAA